MLLDFSNWLEGFGFWQFFNSNDWGWPLFEILHFVGMAFLLGTVGLIDMRILGFAKGLPITKLEALMPFGVAGFLMNAATGVMFVIGNPDGAPIYYLDNLAFQIKMFLVLLAGINVLIFYKSGIARTLAALGPSADAPASAKLVAGASLFFWIGVIFFGRLIMYNDTLLLALGR
jgi:hypothetical protein